MSKERKSIKIIWDGDFDLKDFEEFFEEYHPDATDEEKWNLACKLNEFYLEDEKANWFGIVTDGEIICIADVGRWDSRRIGYKLFGHRASNIFQASEGDLHYCKWFADEKNIRGREEHHDGVNYYTYRILKGDTHDECVENAEKLFSKEINPYRLGRYTKSLLPEVRKIYGW